MYRYTVDAEGLCERSAILASIKAPLQLGLLFGCELRLTALIFPTFQTSTRDTFALPFLPDSMFKLRKRSEHGQCQFAGRRVGIKSLHENDEAHTSRAQRVDLRQHVDRAAAEPVKRVDDECIPFAEVGRALRPAVAAVGGGGAARRLVRELLPNFEASGGNGLPLVFDRLPGGRNAQIRNDAHDGGCRCCNRV